MRTLRWLQTANEPSLYERVVLPGYAHLDALIGRDAATRRLPRRSAATSTASTARRGPGGDGASAQLGVERRQRPDAEPVAGLGASAWRAAARSASPRPSRARRATLASHAADSATHGRAPMSGGGRARRRAGRRRRRAGPGPRPVCPGGGRPRRGTRRSRARSCARCRAPACRGRASAHAGSPTVAAATAVPDHRHQPLVAGVEPRPGRRPGGSVSEPRQGGVDVAARRRPSTCCIAHQLERRRAELLARHRGRWASPRQRAPQPPHAERLDGWMTAACEWPGRLEPAAAARRPAPRPRRTGPRGRPTWSATSRRGAGGRGGGPSSARLGEPVGQVSGRVVGARPRTAGGCGPGPPAAPGRGRRSARRCAMTSAPDVEVLVDVVGPVEGQAPRHQHRGQRPPGRRAAGPSPRPRRPWPGARRGGRRRAGRGPAGPAASARARLSLPGRRSSASLEQRPGRRVGRRRRRAAARRSRARPG